MNFFVISFYGLCVVCAVLLYYTWQKVTATTSTDFRTFQRTYLVVYVLAMAGDWLQGPYVYALYAAYGMSKKEIELLFVAGFGSSMVFGTVIGSVADRFGRRNNCLLYGVLYGASCVTKHFNNFWVLLAGRVLGGMATSILYSAFESWVINEHNKRFFEKEWLGTIFSHAVLGNSLVAIVAGVVAQYAADMFSFVAPFDVAICVLTVMCGFLVTTWTENYGNTSANLSTSFGQAFNSIITDRKILCLGIIQSLFEGSMYCFVLEWTPALTPPVPEAAGVTKAVGKTASSGGHRGKIPHGYIFASFMVAIMVGSSLFKILLKQYSPESFMRGVFMVSALCLALPVFIPQQRHIIFYGFLVFEMCVGLFWPALSTMRGKYVPEETRATIMNCFRIPLNLIVVIILSQNLSIKVVFIACVIFLSISTMCQQWLYMLSSPASETLLPAVDSRPSPEKEALIEEPSTVEDEEEKSSLSQV